MRAALLAALLAAAAPARAAFQPAVGTTSAEWLRLGAGARALGMGEAYTAVADGADAVYWNPAGLARMTRPEASYSRSELLAGLHHDFLAAAVPVRWLSGTLAVGVTRLSSDSLERRDANNTARGSFSPHAEAYSFAYGRRFSGEDAVADSRGYFRDDWNLPTVDRPFADDPAPWSGDIEAGVALKAISEDLGGHRASAFAVDFGGTYRPPDLEALTLAAAMRNLGGKIRFIAESAPLPAEAAGALSYDARTGDWRLIPALEVAAPYAGTPYAKAGLEASTPAGRGLRVALRAGYDTRSVADLGPVSGAAAGVGLRAGRLSFDAAFQPMAVLGESFRVGVGWTFGEAR